MSYDKELFKPEPLSMREALKLTKAKEVKHVNYDQLPGVLKRKIGKYQAQQAKKHPKMTDKEMMQKIRKKFNINFQYE